MQIESVQINNLHFTNDATLFAESPNELQVMVHRMVDIKENFGMKVNIKKTEMQYMRSAHKNFNILIMNQSMKQTFNFVCLEETSVQKRKLYQTSTEIRIARAAFQELGKVLSAGYT